MIPASFRHTLCALFCCGFALLLWASSSIASDKAASSSLPSASRRFSATCHFSSGISESDALIVAQTAARIDVLHTVVKDLVTLPEIRIAGSINASADRAPNLLALAHATARTSLILHGKSRKDATITATVALQDDTDTPAMVARVREALLHPDRLALHEKTVLREMALLKSFDTAFSAPLAKAETHALLPSPETLSPLVRELRALDIFSRQLSRRNGIWQNPAAIREAMQTALELAPESALCRNAMGDALLQLGRSQEALEEQTLAIKAEPHFARAFHSRGAAAMALGHLSSAVADFSEAIRLSPQTATYHQSRGMAWRLLGESKAMCNDLQQACILGKCKEFQIVIENFHCIDK